MLTASAAASAASTVDGKTLEKSTRSSFTCRGRTLHGLSDDHAVLAHDAQITPSLRARSPVYYWRTTTQDKAQHEAICTKAESKWHVVTFGSHAKWAALANRMCHWPEPKVNPTMKYRRHGIGRVVDSCTNLTLASLPDEWARANNITIASRGAGYWKWKPYLILQKLEAVADGDVVAWLDYDLIVAHDLTALFCLAQNAASGIALFHFPCHVERFWTKVELAEAMGATDAMLDTVQIYGGLVIIRKTAETIAFVREWLRWTLEGEWTTDALDPKRQHRHFKAHRHDQSILSLLAKKRNLKTFPFPTKSHDVRDVWTWDAGYCEPGFVWPLPNHRPWNYFGYITHYLEMGHQYKAMLHCIETQRKGGGPFVPLPDYLESDLVLREMANEKALNRAQRKDRWTVASVRTTLPARSVAPLALGLVPKHIVPRPTCLANETYGGFHFDGADHLWVSSGCRGAFLCAGLHVYCGRMGLAGKGLVVCRCTGVNTLEAIRHWNDGAL